METWPYPKDGVRMQGNIWKLRQSSVGLKLSAKLFQECVAVAMYARSSVSDDANFINSGCSTVGFRITSWFPTYTNCFTYRELVVLQELCSLQNYVCSQKLASDIIHVAADGDLHTNYEGTAPPPSLGKKRIATAFCLRYSYRSCRSKQILL
jgi:hypothetical protein